MPMANDGEGTKYPAASKCRCVSQIAAAHKRKGVQLCALRKRCQRFYPTASKVHSVERAAGREAGYLDEVRAHLEPQNFQRAAMRDGREIADSAIQDAQRA